MSLFLLTLLFLPNLLCDISSDGVKADETHITDILFATISRYYKCVDRSSSKCIVECSGPSVPQTQLSWYNGSSSYSNLTISDFNTRLYLEVDNWDKNHYRCEASNSITHQTSYLNITQICQTCPDLTGKKIKTMFVSEGDSVTLHTNITERQNEHIKWIYEGNIFIGKLYANTTTYSECDGGRNKVLDSKTGSLTIKNIIQSDSGLYQLITNRPQMAQECHGYNVIVCGKEIPISLNVGESATLPTNLTEQNQDCIQWLYKENTLIAELCKDKGTCYDCDGCRFNKSLELHNKTGSLTIKNIRKIHSGPYKLMIPEGPHKVCQIYHVTVYDSLPSPVITNESPPSSSSSEKSPSLKCSLLCSVMNVTGVILSWYKGNSLLSSIISVSDLSISVSDRNIRLYLPLEVEYHDTNNYSCVVNNTFTSKTTHLNMSALCKDPRSSSRPDGVAIGVGVGVIALALVGGLVYCYCRRRKTGKYHLQLICAGFMQNKF
nr:hemicentin-2-like [Misgurnus anguillicaudatus]